MTKQEKKRPSAVFRATKYLFLESIRLKLLLDIAKSQTGRSYRST